MAKRQVQFKKFLSQFKSACAIDILEFIKRRYNLEWIELWNSQQKKIGIGKRPRNLLVHFCYEIPFWLALLSRFYQEGCSSKKFCWNYLNAFQKSPHKYQFGTSSKDTPHPKKATFPWKTFLPKNKANKNPRWLLSHFTVF